MTAGNSAQASDGAAMLLLASEEAVDRLDLPVLGRIVDSQWAGVDPAQMGLGPVHAMAPIMERHGFDSMTSTSGEINEAFAAQVLACTSAWTSTDYCRDGLQRKQAFAPIRDDRLNTDGGGISLGIRSVPVGRASRRTP